MKIVAKLNFSYVPMGRDMVCYDAQKVIRLLTTYVIVLSQQFSQTCSVIAIVKR